VPRPFILQAVLHGMLNSDEAAIEIDLIPLQCEEFALSRL
jgi:hypothetical protein